MELEHDQFVVVYDSARVTESEILGSCEKSGFPATVGEGALAESPSASGQSIAEEAYVPPEFYVEALERARREGKPLVLDFMATWCAPCIRLGKETFVEENVAKLLEQCILLKIDTDKHPGIAKFYRVSALPDIRFLDSEGRETKKVLGFQDADAFAIELGKLLGE